MPDLTLTEHGHLWNEDLSVDMADRLVQNVALTGLTSRNGYRYTEEALSTAAGLYAEKPVFLDHAGNRQRPQERSTRDLVGTIVNPRYSRGRIRGDIRVLATESGETFLKLVESNSPGVGMSHVVLAQRSADAQTVERINEVISVDVVVNPATTTTFRESCGADAATGLPSPAGNRLLPPEQEDAELRQELAQLRRRLLEVERRESIRRLLAESGLPAEAVSECFQQQLLLAETSHARQQLIQDRLSLLAAAPRERGRACSQERVPQPGTRSLDDEFLRILRRR